LAAIDQDTGVLHVSYVITIPHDAPPEVAATGESAASAVMAATLEELTATVSAQVEDLCGSGAYSVDITAASAPSLNSVPAPPSTETTTTAVTRGSTTPTAAAGDAEEESVVVPVAITLTVLVVAAAAIVVMARARRAQHPDGSASDSSHAPENSAMGSMEERALDLADGLMPLPPVCDSGNAVVVEPVEEKTIVAL